MFKILISYAKFPYICLITYSKSTNLFFSSKYKLEVVGESVVYTHLMKHRRNEHVSSGLSRCVVSRSVPDVSNGRNSFILSVEQSKNQSWIV